VLTYVLLLPRLGLAPTFSRLALSAAAPHPIASYSAPTGASALLFSSCMLSAAPDHQPAGWLLLGWVLQLLLPSPNE